MCKSGSETVGAALVTGASRGIGRVIALRLARAGSPIAVNYRQSEREAQIVVREIEDAGGRAVALRADVSDSGEACTLIDRAQSALGPISILVNNAGVTQDRLVVQLTEDDWMATWSADLTGPRTLIACAIDAMRTIGGGRIVNLGSVVGAAGNAGQANYAAAKSALLGLTRDAAVRYAAFGITVNCLMPGYFQTDATSHLTAEQSEHWKTRIPAGRFGVVEDIADLVAFLTGDSASYITGQCIAIDGGFLAGMGRGLAS